MTINRVALIFDNKARPETTGLYCSRALGRLVEVDHFNPTDLSSIRSDAFDLYLRIDDGLDYRLPSTFRPCAWWAIDTHLDSARCRETAGDFDLVFVAQRDGTEALRKSGIDSATWLPLACDPDLHHRCEVPKRYDACFVGNLFPGPRARMIEAVQREHPGTFVGQLYFEEMCEVYSASRIVLNQSIRNDVNMRVFEALACGSFLITNDLTANGLTELFQDEIHLVTFQTLEELLDKMSFYLERESVRQRIEQTGYELVRSRHTYEHRMREVLQTTEQWLSSRIFSLDRDAGKEAESLPGAGSTGRSSSYYQHARPEILALIPTTATRILDLGCGTGNLGAALKARQPAVVLGVELDSDAAALARKVLDEVVEGDIEQLHLSVASGALDVVVCGDILEHLREPRQILQHIAQWLSPQGCLITSIPNIRHHSVIRSLLAGNWTYEEAGLLDRDHLRFFTRREMEKLLHRSGFEVEHSQILPGPGDAERKIQAKSGELQVGRLTLTELPPEHVEEFYAYQYLIRAIPRQREAWKVTSIIIVTHNQLAYTQQCIESILSRTDEPYELIFVDNASSDGSQEHLRQIPNSRLIENSENRGFPAAVNQGLEIARGEQILLLNNDTVVTTGWLDRLLSALYQDSSTGLVGPCSNEVSGEQCIPVDYDSLADLDGFAWDYGRENNRKRQQTDRLVGFCLLFRRSVLEEVGPLDERFGIGCFEDDDFTRRARQAGYQAMIAQDAFVHHFGSRTFLGSGVDFAKLLENNQRLFEEKWSGKGAEPQRKPLLSEDCRSKTSSTGLQLRATREGGLELHPSPCLLSLCMIVRDNESTLAAALSSIQPFVDEMVVVDTGSTDRTPEIAREHGAALFHFPWCDDFSAARNVSLSHARGEWIFWMDSDDTIGEENGRQLRALVEKQIPPTTLGFIVSVLCPGSDPGDPDGLTRVTHVKLIRNRSDLRFEHRIHEQILPAILLAGGEVQHTDLFVTHSGYDSSPEGQRRKLERDLRLLHMELQEMPDHPFTLFNIGMTLCHEKLYEVALPYLERCLVVSEPGSSHVRKLCAFLFHCYEKRGNSDKSLEICQRGLRNFPEDAELRFCQGKWLHAQGQLTEAENTYHELLTHREGPHYTSVNEGIFSYLTRHNLALLYMAQNRFVEAEGQWQQIIESQPRYRPGWSGWVECLLQQRKLVELESVLARLEKLSCLEVEHWRVNALLLAARGKRKEARQCLEELVRAYPDDVESRESWCRFLLEEGGRPEEIEESVRQLLRIDPENAAAHHNLGSASLEQSRPEEAVLAYEQALKLRPGHIGSILQLGHALQACGRVGEACHRWQEVLRLSPDHPEALEAIKRARISTSA